MLRDVLGYRAAEVAEMLETTEASVNSLLRRTRAAFDSRLPAAGRGGAPRRADAGGGDARQQPAGVRLLLSRSESEAARAFSFFGLTLEGDRVSAITWFADSSVFPRFGLPRILL